MKLHKTRKGNYVGWWRGNHLFFYKRFHGGWACFVRKNKEMVLMNGYFTKCFPNLTDAKKWAYKEIW